MPFWRRDRKPTEAEIIRMQGDEARRTEGYSDPNYMNVMSSVSALVQILESRFGRFFDPQHPDYHPCYAPLEFWVNDPRLHLGILTEDKARDLCQDIESAEGQADRLIQYFHGGPLESARITEMAKSAKQLISMRVVRGVFLKAVTTQRRENVWVPPETKRR